MTGAAVTDRVGRIYSQNRATIDSFSVQQRLKVLARFVHGNAEDMKATIARAKAHNEAKVLVYDAIQDLHKDNWMTSHDLDSLGVILNRVGQRLRDGDEPAGQEFRLAVFDRAWKVSAGKGKIAILVKSTDRKDRNAKAALKSDLCNTFKDDAGAAQTGAKLAALLNAVKNCPTQAGFAHPVASDLLDVFAKHHDILSSPALWAGQGVKDRSEFFGLPLSLAELERISNKETDITEDDVEALSASLKSSDTAETADDEKFAELLEEVHQPQGANAGPINLAQPKDRILLQMSKVIAEHYRSALNLKSNESAALDQAIESADDFEAVTKALRTAYGDALSGTKLSRNDIAEAIGRAMTAFLHPGRWNGATISDFRAAYQDLNDGLSRKMEALPKSRQADSPPQSITGYELLGLIDKHRRVFSAPVWNEPTHATMGDRLSFARAMGELARLLKEEDFTDETIKPLLTIMKGPMHDEPVIDLDKPREQIRIALVDAVFDRFERGQSAAYRDALGVQDNYRRSPRDADSLNKALLGALRTFMEHYPLTYVDLLAKLNSLRGEVEADTRGKNRDRL